MPTSRMTDSPSHRATTSYRATSSSVTVVASLPLPKSTDIRSVTAEATVPTTRFDRSYSTYIGLTRSIQASNDEYSAEITKISPSDSPMRSVSSELPSSTHYSLSSPHPSPLYSSSSPITSPIYSNIPTTSYSISTSNISTILQTAGSTEAEIVCEPGFKWNPEKQLCLHTLARCPKGMYLSVSKNRCLPKIGDRFSCSDGYEFRNDLNGCEGE